MKGVTMSLYNAIFGQNPLAEQLVEVLGVEPDRFRDAWLQKGEKGEPQIVIHTRTGGGNRECYADDGDCSGCHHTANNKMASHIYFISDEDDDFDCTYADFTFHCPPEFRELAVMLLGIQGETKPAGERWQDLFKDMEAKQPSSEAGKRALAVGKNIMGQLRKVLK